MIVFDIQAVQSRSHGERGIARYCLELAYAIERIAPGRVDRYATNPDRPIPDSLEPLMRSGRVVRSDDLGVDSVSILHCGSPIELDVPLERLVFGCPRRLIVNLYDLIPLVFRDIYLADAVTSARYISRVGIYNSADLVLSDSQSAVDDAVSLLGVRPERCVVLGAGTSDVFRPHPEGRSSAFDEAQRAIPELRKDFIMVPSGIDWRKNIDGVLLAYSRLGPTVREQHQLVLVCRAADSERRHLFALASQLRCADTFLMTGFVSDSTLVSLNQSAYLVVFPSRYEGFGLPVLEARRCGAPVICGDNSSLREVQPFDGARFNVDDVPRLAELLAECVEDVTFLARLRDSEVPDLSWDRAARLTLEAYERAATTPRPLEVMADQRPRVAYVTPLPPASSGVATYSFHLLAALAKIARVRCFCDQDISGLRVPPSVDINPLSDLHALQMAGEFDYVVYALGNNAIHSGALQELRRTPGVVQLHDVRLTNCYANDCWPDVVQRQYPGRFTNEELFSIGSPWSSYVRDRTILLLDEVGTHAQDILVHSSHAANLVRIDTGRRSQLIGPLGTLERKMSHPARPPLLASFGIVSPAKQSPKVLEACDRVIARRADVSGVFVGEVDDNFDRGEGRVLFTGHVSQDEFEKYLCMTSLAIQLREGSNGESSAAVADCLAAGIPTIVTDLGAACELPDNVVRKVPRDISAASLADVIAELLSSPEQLSDLSASARSWAVENTFDAAAVRLLHALTGSRSITGVHPRVAVGRGDPRSMPSHVECAVPAV